MQDDVIGLRYGPATNGVDGWGATECETGARIRVKGGFRRFAIFRTSADERRFLQEAVKIVQHGKCAKLSDITGLNFLICVRMRYRYFLPPVQGWHWARTT